MKITKRILALIMALALCLALAACGGDTTGGATTGGDTTTGGTTTGGDNAGGEEFGSYDIAYNTWGAGVPIFESMAIETEYVLSVAGATATRASDDFMADKELQNIQNFINAGYDGIAMQTCAATVLPEAAAQCQELGIPFCLSIFVGDPADRQVVRETNEYYAGGLTGDAVADGEFCANRALADGKKKVLTVGGNIGDPNIDDRINGFVAVWEANGGEHVSTARMASAAECQEKVNAMLSAYADKADCIYVCNGDYMAGTAAAMETLGVTLPVYLSNTNKDCAPYIKNGTVVCASGGVDTALQLANTLLINFLDGHPIKDADGLAPDWKVAPFEITADNIDAFLYLFYTDGNHVMTDNTIKSLLYRYNPDVTYETYEKLLADLAADGINVLMDGRTVG